MDGTGRYSSQHGPFNGPCLHSAVMDEIREVRFRWFRGLRRLDRRPLNVRNRRTSPVGGRPGDGLLTEQIADARKRSARGPA
jgi:hypothetical protein